MFVVKKCKNCGSTVEFDCAEIPREPSSLDPTGAYWVRFWSMAFAASCMLAGILTWGILRYASIASEREAQLLKDPSVKVEIQEIPNSSPIRKFTREGVK